MLIRPMVAADLSEVAAIQQAASGEAAQWEPADYLAYRSTVADEGGVVRAFLVVREVAAGSECEVLNLAVLPQYRGQGFARSLLREALETLGGKWWLEVRVSNTAARDFYKSQGFQEVGRRHNYYSEPYEDAIVMQR